MRRGIGSTRVAKRQILGKKGVEKVPFSIFLYRIRNTDSGQDTYQHFPIPSHSMLDMLYMPYTLKNLVEVAPKSYYFQPRRSALPGTMSVRKKYRREERRISEVR